MVGFSVSLYEFVVGGSDALEALDQQTDDVGDDWGDSCRDAWVSFMLLYRLLHMRVRLAHLGMDEIGGVRGSVYCGRR